MPYILSSVVRYAPEINGKKFLPLRSRGEGGGGVNRATYKFSKSATKKTPSMAGMMYDQPQCYPHDANDQMDFKSCSL